MKVWSGREDLNFRPQRPERCALTRLRYSPVPIYYKWKRLLWQTARTLIKSWLPLANGGCNKDI
jgi:hypothetical protein